MVCPLFRMSAIEMFHCISKSRLKSAKNQAKSKQNTEAELFLFGKYSVFSSMLSSKNNRRFSKKCTKTRVLGLMSLYD